MENQIVIEVQDGTFRAYISRPAKLPAPAVVVLQECLALTPTSERPATNWPNRGSSRSRRTFLAARAWRRSQRHFRSRLATRSSPVSGL